MSKFQVFATTRTGRKRIFTTFPDFNLQISAKHGSNDDIVGEQKFRSIKLTLTVYFDLSVNFFLNWQNFSRRVSEVHNVFCGNKHSVTKMINLTEMQVQINNSNGSGDYTSFRLTESWITELIAFQIGSM